MFQGSYHITLAGVISDEGFHSCLQCIKDLKAANPGRI